MSWPISIRCAEAAQGGGAVAHIVRRNERFGAHPVGKATSDDKAQPFSHHSGFSALAKRAPHGVRLLVRRHLEGAPNHALTLIRLPSLSPSPAPAGVTAGGALAAAAGVAELACALTAGAGATGEATAGETLDILIGKEPRNVGSSGSQPLAWAYMVAAAFGTPLEPPLGSGILEPTGFRHGARTAGCGRCVRLRTVCRRPLRLTS